MNFQRGQDLGNGIVHFIKQQRVEVLSKCMEVLFLTSNIYSSLVVGVVDGLKMDELSTSRQPLPASSTLAAATVVTRDSSHPCLRLMRF